MVQLRREDLVWREVDGKTLLLDLATSTYLEVNGSASVLWRRLEAGTTRDELVAALVAAYGIDEAAAGEDVDAFLEDCRARGYLDEDAPEGA